jgi:hypothetical protein
MTSTCPPAQREPALGPAGRSYVLMLPDLDARRVGWRVRTTAAIVRYDQATETDADDRLRSA